jgi:hypothetical protein
VREAAPCSGRLRGGPLHGREVRSLARDRYESFAVSVLTGREGTAVYQRTGPEGWDFVGWAHGR